MSCFDCYNLQLKKQISKLIYDENTMAEYLSDPMKVAA